MKKGTILFVIKLPIRFSQCAYLWRSLSLLLRQTEKKLNTKVVDKQMNIFSEKGTTGELYLRNQKRGNI